MEELLVNPKVVALFKERIDTLQQQFAHYEKIKRFTLLPNRSVWRKGNSPIRLK